MWDAIGIAGFLGTIIFVIFTFISLFKRDGKAKKRFILSLVCFFSFSIGVINASAPKDISSQDTVAQINSKEKANSVQKAKSEDELEAGTEVSTQETKTAINTSNTSIPEVQQTIVAPGKKLKVHYIDVGQADSILLQIPNGKNVLIDAGNNDDSQTIIDYLNNQGVKKLDIVIGTHPHEDHIGSLDTIINKFPIGQVIMPRVSHNTQTYYNVLTAIKNKGLKITEAKANLKLDLGREVTAVLLAPNSGSYEDLNNYSAVLKLTYGKNIFLFDGDAEDISENEMLSKGYNLKADVLKVGHHGSSSSTTQEFLNTVKPKYAIISVGTGNSYGHPTQETLDKLSSTGVQIYRTDLNGSIITESDGTNITFKTLGPSVKPRAPNTEVNNTKPIYVPQVRATSSSKNFYIGNVKTMKFHLPTCSRLPTTNRIDLKMSRDKVIAQGYAACKICNP